MVLKRILSLSVLCTAVCLSAGVETFESLPEGVFAQVDCACGTLTEKASFQYVLKPKEKKFSSGDTAEILSGQGFGGGKALRIRGGKRLLVLKAETPFEKENILSFRAKRWTKADPFRFRIEAVQNNGKKTVFSKVYENNKIPMDYSEPISVKLPPAASEVCFVVETPDAAPERAGLLLDNLAWETVKPMKLLKAESVQEVTPMLKGHPANSALFLDVTTEGDENPVTVESVTLRTAGTTALSDLEKIEIVNTADQKILASVKPAQTVTLKGKLPLASGKNRLAVNCVLSPGADIDNHIDVQCVKMTFSDGSEIVPQVVKDQPFLRLGVVLRAKNQDQCHTTRIPGLTTTPKGTLIAVYDNRYKHNGDLQGDIDIGMSRSADGGQNWEPMKVVMDMGKANGFPEDLNGCTDPSVLTDDKTGTVWVAAMWISGVKGHTWFASKPGMEPTVTGQFMLVRSDDDGKTWSKPINITGQMKKPEWFLFFQGPGRGITMRDGTLVFPAQFKADPSTPYSTIIHSKDQGKTWKVGAGARPKTSEAQVVELDDGSLMLNMRDESRSGRRAVSVTKDFGATWTEHPSSGKALVEPVCQASILRWASVKDGAEKSVLLFSNPAEGNGPRRHMTVKASFDEGLTWPEALLFDARNCFGYSCLTKIGETHVGIIYEGERDMYFMRIPIGEILGK